VYELVARAGPLPPALFVYVPDFSACRTVGDALLSAAELGIGLEFWTAETRKADPGRIRASDRVVANHPANPPGPPSQVLLGGSVGVILAMRRGR